MRSHALLAILLGGCTVALRSGPPPMMPDDALSIRELESDRCMHGTVGPDSPFREPLPPAVSDPELAPHLARFSPAVRRTAVAAGIEPLLARLMRERAVNGATAPAAVAMRQELDERLDTLETQLTSMELECDCVRGLLYEVLGAYEETETDRQLAWTIAGLAVGAGVSLISGLWDLANTYTSAPAWSDGPAVIAIAGAVLSTIIGAVVLVRVPREIHYVHEHNILRPIVIGEDPELLYPIFVFRLLTLPTTDGEPTPREALIQAFTELIEGSVGEERRGLAEEIVYGVGGTYDPDLLSAHQEMLQELGAALDSFARDIDLLEHTLAIALEDEFMREESTGNALPHSEPAAPRPGPEAPPPAQ